MMWHSGPGCRCDLEEMQAKQRKRVRQQFRSATRQLALFSTGPHPVIEALQKLTVEELSPLEAINKLYELKRMVEAEDEQVRLNALGVSPIVSTVFCRRWRRSTSCTS